MIAYCMNLKVWKMLETMVWYSPLSRQPNGCPNKRSPMISKVVKLRKFEMHIFSTKDRWLCSRSLFIRRLIYEVMIDSWSRKACSEKAWANVLRIRL